MARGGQLTVSGRPASPAAEAPGATEAGSTAAPTAAEVSGHHAWSLRGSLLVWLGSRVALVTFVVAASWMVGIDQRGLARAPVTWVLERFTYWDSLHFLRIAELGYLPKGLPCCDQAFFPGYPVLIAGVAPLVGHNFLLAALLIAHAAGAVAAVMLWRLTAESAGRRAAFTAVLLLSVAPYGLFLTAAYSESVFLAFAVSAWWAATRRRWWLAGVLAGAAAGIRVNGLFLAVALGVMYVVQLRSDGRLRPRRDAAALLVPFAVTAAFFGYLFARTGAVDAWHQAEATGWSRRTAWPWEGIAASWHSIQTASSPDLVVSRWADLVTVLAGVVLVAALVALRRWPEVVYVGCSVGVILCSTMFVSAPRYALTWFPAYVLLAQLAERQRWRWLRVAVPSLCVPLLFTLALAFSSRDWVG